MSDLSKIILIVMIVVGLIIIGPLLTIWAMNTLFPTLSIPYAIETWAALMILGAFLRANVSVKGK